MCCKITLFTFIYQVCAVFSVGTIIDTITVNNHIIETCVVNMFLSKALHGSDVVIIKSKIFDDELIQKLHKSSNIRIYLKDYNVPVNIAPHVYLLHCDGKETLGNIIDRLDKDWYRQPRSLYVFVLTKLSIDDLPWIFELLWDYYIIHVLIILEDTTDASVYSYLPYAARQCGRGYNNTINIGHCTSVIDFDVVEKLRELDKPDLRNCTLNVLAHYYPPLVLEENPTDIFMIGIERFLVGLLLELQNVSVNLTLVDETVDFGSILDNFTITGAMAKLYGNEVDLLFGGFSLSYKRAVFFSFIYIHLAFEDVFIPVTPIADLEDRWKIVFMMFQYKVWLLLMLIMFFCSLMLSNFNKSFLSRYNCSSELMTLFGNATQNIVLKLRDKLFKNMLIVHWLWFMFLMSCYYQTRLTSYSTFRAYKPQLNEYMSLYNYNLTPCIPHSTAVFLKSSGIVPIINEERLEVDNCETGDMALNEVAKSSSKYTVTIYYRYLWWASQHLREKSKVHLMKENLFKTHYALFFRRGFPLLQEFQATMSRIVEYGFVQGIKRLHQIPSESRYAGDAAGAFEVRLLTLHDLIIPFIILAAGYLIAMATFYIEMVHRTDKSVVLN